ncbi:sensor domain-containing diguanylate cyclase [Curvibacter sp. RS43]|uniref:Sensor domain-containing diguanylate cyclase n=1 Tax=Curvibacter microcysteis TaxID=3026419 RepID=A0ABT5MA88_9BURK|nr:MULTISPECIES: diguanylate cyclase [unclassified Curvibacter]MDD0811397.1 sensor domain-containing diguanylate cyclase [Curvibacter sp. RS43]MDD0813502.1 sensor domain-containing diguanylate cyclase [Curvibacter sp. HBC28]
MRVRPAPWAAARGRLSQLAWGAGLLLLAWLLAGGWGQAEAQALAPSRVDPPVMTLRAGPEGVALSGALGVLIDDSGTLQIDDVRSPAHQPRFAYPAAPVRSAMDPRAYWFQVRLRQTGSDGDWLIAVPSVAARELSFYGPYDAQGQALAEPVHTGIAYPFSTRPLQAERMVYRFRLQSPGEVTVYVRAVSRVGQIYALSAWDTGDYLAGVQSKRLFDGLSYGILLGMLVYNFALMLLFRDRVYGYYLLNCFFALLSIANFNGHAARYLWPDQPPLAEWSYVLAPAFWIIGGALFARRFLDLARFAPWIDRFLAALIGLQLLAVAVAGFDHLPWLVMATELGAMMGAVAALVGAVIGFRRGFKPAGLYIAGLLFLFGAVFLLILSNRGVLSWTPLHLNALQLGVAAELVVFSVALGTRIRVMRRAQRELNQRAEQLAIAAETDSLTGLANRAGLAQAAARLLVGSKPHALMLLDLDRFKPINDQHGHEAGDAVLMAVGQRLQAQLRPGDLVARLGGDEFVILLAEVHERPNLAQLAERLWQAVQQPVAWQHVSLQVQASLGIARYPQDGRNLVELQRAADRAMYHVKQSKQAGHAFHEDLPDGYATLPAPLL